jgi:hypothetical protein
MVAFLVQQVSSKGFGDKEGDATKMIDEEVLEKQQSEKFLLGFQKKHIDKGWAQNGNLFFRDWENEQVEYKKWQKRHAKLMETAWKAKDGDLEELHTEFRDDTQLKIPITLVMAENRLDSGLWRASVAQKHAYAKKNGYGFHISASGKYTYDPENTKISPRSYANADGLVAMCEYILTQDVILSDKVKLQLRSCADIPKTRNLGRGIGLAREATTDKHMPMYLKKSLYWQLEGAGTQPNQNYDQDFGVLDGTWSKVPTALEAMRALPDGTWLWVLDTDIAIMEDSMRLDYIVNFAEKLGKEFIVCTWNCGDGMNMGSVMVKNTEWGRGLYQAMIDMRLVWHSYFFHSATGNTEQGAMWTMQAGDVQLGEKTYSAPPRTFNTRHELIECAQDEEAVARVYVLFIYVFDIISHIQPLDITMKAILVFTTPH